MDRRAAAPFNLPDEIAATVYRIVGLKAALSTLPNSRLHKAWQAAIESLTVDTHDIADTDINIIRKYTNLKSLTFNVPGRTTDVPVPVWHVVASVAPYLVRLSSLNVTNAPGTFATLLVISGSEALKARLEQLVLQDEDYTLAVAELWALTRMMRLRILKLKFKELTGTSVELRQVACRLKSLRALYMDTAGPVSGALLAAFPGALVDIHTLSLTAQASSPLWNARQDQALVSAISSLTNLQDLGTSYNLRMADAQHQALKNLKQLTRLHFTNEGPRPFAPQHFVMLYSLPALVELAVPKHTVKNPFGHPALETLVAYELDVGDEWRGQEAGDCRIKQLYVKTYRLGNNMWLANLPNLPALQHFVCRCMEARDGRHVALAAALRRNAEHLEAIDVHTRKVYQERLPQAMPRCRMLNLCGYAVNRSTLHVLSMCRMDSLEEVCLGWASIPMMADELIVEEDLGWLRQLPRLRKFWMYVEGAMAYDLKTALRDMLPGVEVKVGPPT